MNVFDEFAWRELIHDQSKDVAKVLGEQAVTVYAGFDPTAPSLHVGHFVPMLGLARMQRAGHTPIAVAGGGTGLIGDPSGKSEERKLMGREEIDRNMAIIRQQLAAVLDFEVKGNTAVLLDNAEWLTTIPLVEFLRDIGKHFTVNSMLARESVSRRLGEGGDGLSFTEFSYMLMQAYDFLMLHDRYGCTLQVGGSDQWGNIVAGIELIRRTRQKAAHGLTYPLITKADGSKFGKTETGTVWLAPELTSPFKFFQYWLNTDDRDAVRYLKYFTFLSADDIAGLADATAARPAERAAQRRLASELTRMVHGDTALERAEKATAVLFGGDLSELPAADLLEVFDDAPSSTVATDELGGDGMPLADLLARVAVAPSKREARRLIKEGGIQVNSRRAADGQVVTAADAVEGQLLVIKRGRKSYHLIKLESNPT